MLCCNIIYMYILCYVSLFRSVKELARLSLQKPVYVSIHEKDVISTPTTLRQVCCHSLSVSGNTYIRIIIVYDIQFSLVAFLQKYMICPAQDKLNVVWSFLQTHHHYKIIVFLSSCKQVQ